VVFAAAGVLTLAARLAGGDAEEPGAGSPSMNVTAEPLDPYPDPPPPPRFGDAHLRGSLELGRARVEDGRVVAPLEGDRTAVLTIDPELQAHVDALLVEADAPYAAIVVMSIDGRLLAVAGRSRAAPSLGVADLVGKPWAPSASVFKLVTAAALLERGVKADDPVCYHGGVRSVDASNLRDDPRRDTHCDTLAAGVARSQNAIIAKLAAKHLDAESLRAAAEAFGYGAPLDLAIAAEPSTADIPDDELERARAAAGFWHSELSPLGGAVLANVIASGGRLVTPRVVHAVIERGEEQTLIPAAPRRTIDEETAAAVAAMMIGTTETGTARKAFRDGKGRPWLDVDVAGKTGSLTRRKPEWLDYSWFVGFAPADSPEVVVSVLLGNGAGYRFKAHTLARLVLEATRRE
jgi:cell division protein FtsI/penicillin-binding protein 2